MTVSKCIAAVVLALGVATASHAGAQNKPVGVEGQEQACAGAFSEAIDVRMSEVRISGSGESASGHNVYFLQTADGTRSASCEVDDYGKILELATDTSGETRNMPVGVEGQEQACAGAFSEAVDVPMSEVRINGSGESASGHNVYYLQTADTTRSANCEVDDYGNILDLAFTR